MKTTVEITDSLLADARRQAEREGTTVRALIEEGLRTVLRERQTRGQFRLRLVTFTGNGLSPEFADAGWDKIRDAICEGHGA